MNTLLVIISLIIVGLLGFGFGFVTADNLDQKKWIDFYEAQYTKSVEKLEAIQGGDPDV